MSTLSLAKSHTETKQTRFGSCLIEESDLLSFPRYIYGFENLTEYALVPLPKIGEPFFLLLSLEKDDLSFITRKIPQNEWGAAYRSKVQNLLHVIPSLALGDEIPDLFLMTTLTCDRSYELNWPAPLIVSKRQQKAWQVILES